MKQTTERTNAALHTAAPRQAEKSTRGIGGLRVRTDLRAGLAWDDLDDQAQKLWANLTNAIGSLSGSADTNG